MNGEETDPQSTGSDVLADRRAKLERLREAGVEPFPHEFAGREPIAAVREASRVR